MHVENPTELLIRWDETDNSWHSPSLVGLYIGYWLINYMTMLCIGTWPFCWIWSLNNFMNQSEIEYKGTKIENPSLILRSGTILFCRRTILSSCICLCGKWLEPNNVIKKSSKNLTFLFSIVEENKWEKLIYYVLDSHHIYALADQSARV